MNASTLGLACLNAQGRGMNREAIAAALEDIAALQREKARTARSRLAALRKVLNTQADAVKFTDLCAAQCAIEVRIRAAVERLDTGSVSPEIEQLLNK